MKTLLSVEILVVDAFNFASCLERRALKLSSYEPVFQEILKIFNSQLNQEFIKHNQKNIGKNASDSLKLDTKNFQMS